MGRKDNRRTVRAGTVAVLIWGLFDGASSAMEVSRASVLPPPAAVQARLRWITIAATSPARTEEYFVRLGLQRTHKTLFTPTTHNPLLFAGTVPVRLLLLETPGEGLAGIRIVPAHDSSQAPARSQARPHDYGFFDVAFAARDTRAVHNRLSSAGIRCTEVVEYEVPSPANPRIRESLCQAPDLVNTVFLQRVGEESQAELRGILSSVRTVADPDRSAAVYRRLGFETISDYVYDADGVRHIVELQPGFRLRIMLLQSTSREGARILLFGFLDPLGHPMPGHDLRERETPQHAGIYLWSFEVADLDRALNDLRTAGARSLTKPVALAIPPYYGARAATLQLPDGARVELIEARPAQSRPGREGPR